MTKPKGINTFLLLATAFEQKRAEMCLDLVAGIYSALLHRVPPISLKRKWVKEIKARCANTSITGGDFEIKTLARRGKPTGMYYISLRSCTHSHGRTSTEAYLNYSNTDLCMGIDGRRDWIARRALQMASTHGSTLPRNPKTKR